eukprot:575941-Amphidinium_carterae.1
MMTLYNQASVHCTYLNSDPDNSCVLKYFRGSSGIWLLLKATQHCSEVLKLDVSIEMLDLFHHGQPLLSEEVSGASLVTFDQVLGGSTAGCSRQYRAC